MFAANERNEIMNDMRHIKQTNIHTNMRLSGKTQQKKKKKSSHIASTNNDRIYVASNQETKKII